MDWQDIEARVDEILDDLTYELGRLTENDDDLEFMEEKNLRAMIRDRINARLAREAA